MNLRIPGPTPLLPEVVDAVRRPMIDHRGAAFFDLNTIFACCGFGNQAHIQDALNALARVLEMGAAPV